jgi:hypothetical protein
VVQFGYRLGLVNGPNRFGLDGTQLAQRTMDVRLRAAEEPCRVGHGADNIDPTVNPESTPCGTLSGRCPANLLAGDRSCANVTVRGI